MEQAEGGTLFLDEVAEMSPSLRLQLLRFLQEKQFRTAGRGTHAQGGRARGGGPTHQRPGEGRAEGRFREDLMYRLNVPGGEAPFAA
ncbi:sigma 54-interacting transcriptional regulator [Corallococcus exiguus]|nr:sigma 54-interacting transcriptional regulator [Corallococcus exiguus]